MQYITLGSTGAYVSKLILGTLDFGSNITEQESFAIMDRAVELGINFFDTANSYGTSQDENSRFGLAESIIGKWFAKENSRRDKIILNTKCYMELGDKKYGPNDREGISAYKMRLQLEDSLRRLQTDHVELYTMHKYQQNMNWKEVWDTYEYFFHAGKVFYAGASNFTAYAIARCQEEARRRNLLGLVSEQNRYNLCCREIETEMTEALRQEHISLLAWSPLYGGRLSAKVFNPPKTGRRIRHALSPELAAKLRKYADLCHSYGFTEEDAALSWLIHNPNVDCVLIGGNSVKEVEDCVRCLDLVLPEELLKKLEALFPGYPLAQNWYMGAY